MDIIEQCSTANRRYVVVGRFVWTRLYYYRYRPSWASERRAPGSNKDVNKEVDIVRHSDGRRWKGHLVLSTSAVLYWAPRGPDWFTRLQTTAGALAVVVVESGRARRPDFRPRISADRVSRDVAPRETRMDVRARLIMWQNWEMSYVAVWRHGDQLCLKVIRGPSNYKKMFPLLTSAMAGVWTRSSFPRGYQGLRYWAVMLQNIFLVSCSFFGDKIH